jgi:hypothetical protein
MFKLCFVIMTRFCNPLYEQMNFYALVDLVVSSNILIVLSFFIKLLIRLKLELGNTVLPILIKVI